MMLRESVRTERDIPSTIRTSTHFIQLVHQIIPSLSSLFLQSCSSRYGFTLGFLQVEITGVPENTKDKDEILESEFFDTRQAFLSLCQGNHYQYDTLRRAKHSSMMVLYHLHNPTAPAFVTTCNECNLDIETGQGWRCETCPDYEICNSCYDKGDTNHPHSLTNNQSSDHEAQNKEARQSRVTQVLF